jgi:Neuraminidase (sialidase)
MCQLSDDGGRTWRRSKSVINLADDAMSTGLQEPGVIELEGGRLMMFCRTGNGAQYLSYSEDGGDTWSEPEKSAIVSPCSPASIKRIPATGDQTSAHTGDLLLVWNNNFESGQRGAGRRTPLNTAVSDDEGAAWTNIKVLENDPNGWYCYTAIAFVEDRVLLGHCAGDRRTSGLATTQITMFSVDWLYS